MHGQQNIKNVEVVLHIVVDIYEKVGKSEFSTLMLFCLPELYSTLNGMIRFFELTELHKLQPSWNITCISKAYYSL